MFLKSLLESKTSYGVLKMRPENTKDTMAKDASLQGYIKV